MRLSSFSFARFFFVASFFEVPCACDNVSRQLGLSATHSCSQHANFMWLTYERCLVLHSKGLRRFYKVSASRRTLLSSLELRLLCCLGCLVDRSWLRSFFTFVNGGRTAARVFFSFSLLLSLKAFAFWLSSAVCIGLVAGLGQRDFADSASMSLYFRRLL